MFKFIKNLFKTPSLQSRLDLFIASKNPSNTAEVEHWVNYYLYSRNGSVL